MILNLAVGTAYRKWEIIQVRGIQNSHWGEGPRCPSKFCLLLLRAIPGCACLQAILKFYFLLHHQAFSKRGNGLKMLLLVFYFIFLSWTIYRIFLSFSALICTIGKQYLHGVNLVGLSIWLGVIPTSLFPCVIPQSLESAYHVFWLLWLHWSSIK